jgi:hypothetical protein
VLSKTRRKDVGRSQEEGLGTVRGHAGWLGGEDHLLGRVPTLPWRYVPQLGGFEKRQGTMVVCPVAITFCDCCEYLEPWPTLKALQQRVSQVTLRQARQY